LSRRLIEAIEKKRKREKSRRNPISGFFFFETGSGAYPPYPRNRGRRPSRSLSRPSIGIQIPELGPHWIERIQLARVQFGNWAIPTGAIGQLAISNPIQFPDSMRAIQLVGLAKEAELMPSPSCGQRAMTACVFPPSLEITDYSGRVQSFTIKDVSVAIVRYRCAIAAVVMLQSNRP
jgi:hypothetical protein